MKNFLIFCLAFVRACVTWLKLNKPTARRVAVFGVAAIAAFLAESFLGRFFLRGMGTLVMGITATQLSSNLPQSLLTQYDKRFIPPLRAELAHIRCTERRKLEMNAGNQLRLFMYNTLGPNLVQATEGMTGAGRTVQVSFNTTTIGEIADFISLSKYCSWTSLDDAIVNIRTELAYALGLTLATFAKNTADGWAAIDGASLTLKAANQPFVGTDITNAVQGMLLRNIKPFDVARRKFAGVISPACVGDAINDKSNNSITDVRKHVAAGHMLLEELPGPEEVDVLEWGGAEFYQSTLVTTTANYQGSGKTGFRTYLYGENGVITLSLGPTDAIGDGRMNNLKLVLEKTEATSVADMEGMIGGWTSYRLMPAWTVPPDTVMRGRLIDSNSNVT